MDLKPGYKLTEVGVIPEEWECRKLDDYISFISYGFTNPMPTVDDGIYMVTAADIGDGRIRFETARKTGERAYSTLLSPKSKPKRNDILLTKDGSLGRLALVGDETMCINQSVAVLRPNERVEPSFLKMLLESSHYQQRMLQDAGGSTIKHIYITVVNLMEVAVPPVIEEQRAIASVLRDVDALLEGLSRLIVKKRDLKQAAMQQLLTGQSRLPGFYREWEVKLLGEIGEIASAGVDKKIRSDEVPVRLLNYLDVYRNDFINSEMLGHWVSAPARQVTRCSVRKGDIFFTPTSETRDDIARSAVAFEDIPDAVYSYHVVRYRLSEPWDLKYRTYAFKTREFLEQAERLCDGNGTRYVISQQKFRSMAIKVPPVSEQAAIGAVLFDMDAELSALEARRDKTRALKEAMMQELLTGRTRLV